MLPRIVRWLPALVWMAVIFYWSAQSVLPIDGQPDTDRLHLKAHVIAYAVLALLCVLGTGTSRRGLALALLVTALYGVSDEVHQSFVPGRKGRVQEVVVNAGSAAAALAAFVALRAVARGRPDTRGEHAVAASVSVQETSGRNHRT